ncbi:MAG: XcyI family restriction endonuclease [Bacteroidia bacterium]|nr:XcyI family restriction endonuclease [Bacteroidia bacterium]
MHNQAFPILDPSLQVDFFLRLKVVRTQYLREALSAAIAVLSVTEIDQQLATFVPADALNQVARLGIRGEQVFPIPIILEANPYLLGYYRLLLGFSQKEFYKPQHFGKLKAMEEKGKISDVQKAVLSEACRSLCGSSVLLTGKIAPFAGADIDSLQLLTLGPQLRGGQNNSYGQIAAFQVLGLIREFVQPYLTEESDTELRIASATGRDMIIRFASDPDIVIYEQLSSSMRGLISIEIKGGRDMSNIHNRIGEAEKSHQKARANGFFEFMTIINVDFDHAVLKQESPTTNHFFNLTRLLSKQSSDYQKFKELFFSILSI